jgi:hypothetical protein
MKRSGESQTVNLWNEGAVKNDKKGADDQPLAYESGTLNASERLSSVQCPLS